MVDTGPWPSSRRTKNRLVLGLVIVALAAIIGTGLLGLWPKGPIGPAAASNDVAGGWGNWGNNPGGERWSPLDQVNRDNVRGLEVAWRYATGEWAKKQASGKQVVGQSFQATPVLFDRRLIGCTDTGTVFAVDAATGQAKWKFDPHLRMSNAAEIASHCRGVSLWTDDQAPTGSLCKTRVLHAAALSVYALDATTGRACPAFGKNGVVRAEATGLRYPDEVALRGPATVIGGVAAFGSVVADGERADSPSGKIRAFDLRTGALRWEFDPVPRDPKDPATASWGKGSYKYVGAGNVWSIMSADPKLNLIYAPTSSPAADYYGGHRPGDNRYTNSLVALDASTGKLRWYFQTSHHDVWDYDLPAQPILTNIVRAGRTIPAVVQLTKQGFVFVFDRRDGKPLYPIVEKPVPQASVVGEPLSPTQPYPTAIAPLVKQGLQPDEVWGLTPYDRSACRRMVEKLDHRGLYAPPSLQGTVTLPATIGGANWSGGAIDKRTGTLIVPVTQMPAMSQLVPRPKGWRPPPPGSLPFSMADAKEASFEELMLKTPYISRTSFITSPFGIPCSGPPWAKLVAVDLGTGKVRWSVTLGDTSGFAPLGLPLKWGAPFSGGPITTAGGLIFMAGTSDGKMRAFDLESGKVLWSTRLPAGGMATPMTYSIDGRQYVVVAAGGSIIFPGKKGDTLMAFALPRNKISARRPSG